MFHTTIQNADFATFQKRFWESCYLCCMLLLESNLTFLLPHCGPCDNFCYLGHIKKLDDDDDDDDRPNSFLGRPKCC